MERYAVRFAPFNGYKDDVQSCFLSGPEQNSGLYKDVFKLDPANDLGHLVDEKFEIWGFKMISVFILS